MSRESLVFILGIITFLTPFMGVPEDWKFYTIVVCGVCLVLIGYSLRRSAYLRRIDRGNGERSTDSFAESTQGNMTSKDQV